MRKKTFFTSVNPKQSFPELEKEILAKWAKEKTFQKLQRKNKGNPPYSFMDGPITANNPMGVHHAWGRTLKDAIQRYKAMHGYDERWQNGFDCQGLWVEVEVEKELKLNSKPEIEKYGLDKFSQACRARVEKYSQIQTQQSIRLGQWMDWKNSYYTLSEENNLHIWHFLKECHKKDLIYKGETAIEWCPRCGTALSQHELSDGGYQELTHQTVYFLAPVKDKPNEFFLIWTTTPWTIVANTALAVNPEITYVRVKQNNQIYILAKKLVTPVLGQEVEILEEFSGQALVDKKLDYISPFAETEVQQNFKHTLIPCAEASEDEGTGIIHIAPGCGDYAIGQQFNLKVIAPLDEKGNFLTGYGFLTGKYAHAIKQEVFDYLKTKGLLYKTGQITHRYPCCWRCKTECVWRLVNEWFIKTAPLKDVLRQATDTVNWCLPADGKRMHDWLNNMGDWIISRKRFWGLALPFYPCDCGELIVVGSKEELKTLALSPEEVDQLPELHRPWIDQIKIKCPHCGKTVNRVPDVGDCWLDAGIVPYSTLKYLSNRKYWQKWFPVESICEMQAQIRLWFYSMLFMSVVLEDKAPYQNVLTHGTVVAEDGRPMHKSSGNAIWFDEAADKMGADVMRFLYCCANNTTSLRFGYNVGAEATRKLLQLWNAYSFFITYANIDEWAPTLNQEPLCPLTKKEKGKLLITRHGEAENNVQGVCNSDPAKPFPLTARGRRQSQELGLKLKAQGIDLIIASPFPRTKESAEIINQFLETELIFDERLTEIRAGSYEGKDSHAYDTRFNSPEKIYHERKLDEETEAENYARVTPLLKEIAAQYPDKNILLVTHNSPARNLLKHLLGWTETQTIQTKLPNCGIACFDLPSLGTANFSNELDAWIISELVGLTQIVSRNLDDYNIPDAFNPLVDFIDDLTNWYIRRSRRRFWKSENDTDKQAAYQTLHTVLVELTKLMAPFLPFLAEEISTNLTKEKSVHLQNWPLPNLALLDLDLNQKVKTIKTIVSLGLAARAKQKIKVRQPLSRAQVGLPGNLDPHLFTNQKAVIEEELNVKSVEFVTDISRLGQLIAKPDARKLGPKYGSAVQQIIQFAKQGQFEKLPNGKIKVSTLQKEFTLESDEFEIVCLSQKCEEVEYSNGIAVKLDTVITPELEAEGLARELVRTVQELRKQADYQITDRIRIAVSDLRIVPKQYLEYLKQETLALEINQDLENTDAHTTLEIGEQQIEIGIKKIVKKSFLKKGKGL
ncbi:hypothetical protein COT40_00990 [Candidatus Peregrinibacteria bacterium CG08_land_8_20_14_0_20_41_10]|nr:MAG: hypothetical protein COT40_00990 [Candidatus Peregrinibacteria bacterium CG08_land_8_20_14_0_20_41_10]